MVVLVVAIPTGVIQMAVHVACVGLLRKTYEGA